ncbi:MAG: hypothetical protein WEA61_04950 [Anaerolineales bacterium]
MFTATPENSPTPAATATETPEPWVDLPITAEVVKKDTWEIPPFNTEAAANTTFFGIVETGGGDKYIVALPFEINPNEYASAEMYWVRNGTVMINGTTYEAMGGRTGTATSNVNHMLNLYNSSPGEIDGIVIEDIDVSMYEMTRANLAFYKGAHFEGVVSESLEPMMEAVVNGGVFIVLSNDGRNAYILNKNATIPDDFFEEHADWRYFAFPFASDQDNPLLTYNIFSESFDSLLGSFEIQNGELDYVANPAEVTVKNLLDMDNLGNDFEITP